MNNATDELIRTYTEILSRARVAYDNQLLRVWPVRFGYNFLLRETPQEKLHLLRSFFALIKARVERR